MQLSLAGASLSLVLVATNVSAEAVEFSEELWDIQAQEWEITSREGKAALMLQGGNAVLKGVEFENGVVEFKILFDNERGFSGGFWRLQDALNSEQFYIRPHQSGMPDANQYQPLFNGNASWQLYHGPGYSAPVEYPHGEWVHVKIVFSGQNAAFHIDSQEPAFVTGQLKHQATAGGVGVYASNFAPAWFADFKYHPLAGNFEFGTSTDAPPAAEGMVGQWEISSAFNWSALDQLTELGPSHTAALEWEILESEPTGITNISRIRTRLPEANTVFARLLLESETEQLVPLTFGYSDLARVYVNGRLLYQGHKIYQSRDYRYLGTIGLFDAVGLPLDKGMNELLIAVGENFGGWGIMAMRPGDDGVRLLHGK